MILHDYDNTTKLSIYKADKDPEQQRRNIANKVIDNNMIAVVGTTGCLEEGTLIQTRTGLKPIEQISKGELVKTYNFKLNKEEYRQAIPVNSGEQEIYLVELTNGSTIRATADHIFFVQDTLGNITEKELKNINVNERIVINPNITKRCEYCNNIFHYNRTKLKNLRKYCTTSCVVSHRNKLQKGKKQSQSLIKNKMKWFLEQHNKNFILIGGWQCMQNTKHLKCAKLRFEQLTIEALLNALH